MIEEVISESPETAESTEAKIPQQIDQIEKVETPMPKPENQTNIKLVVIITVVSALVAAVVSGGVYVYLSGVESAKTQQDEATPTPTSSPTPTTAATPVPEPVDVSEYSVQVLNGSGAIGAASAGENILTQAGFEVVAAGNAANYNFETTVIQAKSGVPAEAVDRAKDALEKSDYKIELGEALSSSSEYDIIVTVGSN